MAPDVRSFWVIRKVGYDPNMHRDATAFEEPDDRCNEKRFIELCANDPYFVKSEIGEAEIASVGCSHFNQLIVMCIDHVPYAENDKITVNGRLSAEKFTAKYPAMQPLFTEGMEWAVWKAAAETMYPTLPMLAERALNAKNVAQQDEHAFQMYHRAVVMAETYKKGRTPLITRRSL